MYCLVYNPLSSWASTHPHLPTPHQPPQQIATNRLSKSRPTAWATPHANRAQPLHSTVQGLCADSQRIWGLPVAVTENARGLHRGPARRATSSGVEEQVLGGAGDGVAVSGKNGDEGAGMEQSSGYAGREAATRVGVMENWEGKQVAQGTARR